MHGTDGIDLRELDGARVWTARLYRPDGSFGPIAGILVYPAEEPLAVGLTWSGGVTGHPYARMTMESPGGGSISAALVYIEPGVPEACSVIV